MRTSTLVTLTDEERAELSRRSRSRILRASDVRLARLILALDRGDTYVEIAERLECDPGFIARWKKRFLEGRLAGLYPRYRGRPVEKRTPKLEAKILDGHCTGSRKTDPRTGAPGNWGRSWESPT